MLNKKKLENAKVKIEDHDACGVGFVASMTGKPKREVVENGIEALKLFGIEVLWMLMERQEMEQEFILNLVEIF